MKYVVDCSVAFKWVVPESNSDKADRLRDAYRNAIHELLAPDIFTLELAHALTRAERQGRIPVGQAAVLWADVLLTPPLFFPSRPLTRVLHIPTPCGVDESGAESPWHGCSAPLGGPDLATCPLRSGGRRHIL
jgi:hypothetical protein